ncbi:hypothetical protein [Wolbachia endosymbiont of Chironomus riparius]|jgi:hypothetical protein|uniref:hypothetical protein n=1 Tax=Wolbachia endosymbiont of Chironomus riparius TaxID=2883238 RepID=UPI0020A10A0E|nr:hypothetical protein [Wolbachia endosymbiont of Chironomus riparius]
MVQEIEVNNSFGKIARRALLFPLWVVGYTFNPLNWSKSNEEVKGDFIDRLIQVVDCRPRIRLRPVKMSRHSEALGVSLIPTAAGVAGFSIPAHHCGRIYELKRKEINRLEKDNPNVYISIEGRMMTKIMIEIDTENIQSQYQHLDEKSKKVETTEGIEEKIYSSLVPLIKATNATAVLWADSTIISSTAKLLYDSHNYTEHQEKEIFTDSCSDSVLICIYNKGILTGYVHEYNKVQENKEAKKVKLNPGSPGSSLYNTESTSIGVKQSRLM